MTHHPNTPASRSEPVAVLRFERNVPGRENDMPRVVSCNWQPDGEYPVYLAASRTEQAAPSVASGEVKLINPGSPEASAMIDSVLFEYGWPSNPKNAARAGFVAAQRLAAPGAAPVEQAGAVSVTNEQIDEIGKPFALHVMAPRGKESVREFARELLAFASRQAGPVIGWLYDWTHSSALGKPDENFTSFTADEHQARTGKGNRNVRAVSLAAPGAAIAAREQERLLHFADAVHEQLHANERTIQHLCNELANIARTADRGGLHAAITKRVRQTITTPDDSLASRQEAPAASAQDTVAREDFDKLSQDLTRAKNLLVNLYDQIARDPSPEKLRGMIERRTGSWFVWGVDRDSAAPTAARSPATVAQPVTDEQIRRLFVAHGHLYAGSLELGRSILALRPPSAAAQPCPYQGCGGDGGEAVRRVSADEDKILRSAALDSSVLVAHGRAVEVCPECDIADCRHIRERRRAALSGLEHVGKESE